MPYINFDGAVYDEREKLFGSTNRALRYGDGFFESMVMFNSRIPLLDFHWERILRTAEAIGAYLPDGLHKDAFLDMCISLIQKNEVLDNARIRLQLFRQGEGLYLSHTNQLSFIISLSGLSNNSFIVGDGLSVGLAMHSTKSLNAFSSLKSSSAIGNVIAANEMVKAGWDEMILCNINRQVSETINSNLFLVYGERLVTPTLDSGCVDGIVRSLLLRNINECEEREVLPQELDAADEILLTNAVQGIRWVKTLNGKIYGNKKAVELTAFLNSL